MVSNRGRVKSLDKAVPTKVSKTGNQHYRHIPGQILDPWDRGRGYATVSLLIEGKRKAHQVHRLVLAAFVGPIPAGLEVRHLNGRKTDNRTCNLCYGTSKENTEDNFRLGKIGIGEKSARAQLTDAQVPEIRALYDGGGLTVKAMAEMYGVTHDCMRGVVSRRNWKHI